MKLPKSVTILGKKYKISEQDRVLSDDSRVLWGEIRYSKMEIAISTKTPCPDPLHTLIHEIVHGCCDDGGIELDEKNVTRLASILSDTLTRNGLIK